MQVVRAKTSANRILLLLVILMVARFSCIMLSDVFLMSMGYVFVYGIMFTAFFLFHERYFKKTEFVIFVFLLIYIIDVGVVTISEEGNIFNTQAYNAYIMLFLYMIYLFVKRATHTQAKIILGTTITGFLFTYVFSIIKLIQDPLLSRKAASTAVSDESVQSLGSVGGFDTVYGSILVICILLFVLKKMNKKFMKALVLMMIFVACIFLVMASYGTALMLLVLLFGLWIFQKNRYMCVVVVVVGIVLLIYHEQVGSVVADLGSKITYSRTLSQKVEQIGNIIQTGESAGTLAGDEGRLARMGWSWNAFLKYPLFGGFGKDDIKIGSHSELFDTLGRFGIIGTMALLGFIGLMFKDIYARMQTADEKKCCLICYVLYGIVMVLNPALYTQQLLPIFVILPRFKLMYNKGDERDV